MPTDVAALGFLLLEGIGERLHTARSRWKLTLRDVEERSFSFARQWGNPKYRISASWLDRVERENGGLSATKLIVLAAIYGLSAEQMLGLRPNAKKPLSELEQVPRPKATVLLTPGLLEEHAKRWLPDELASDLSPEKTSLLPVEEGLVPSRYRRGVIGTKDRTLEPMVPAGSLLLIDTEKRTLAARNSWNHEFDRPIYFLYTRSGYVTGFCELDKKAEWLTLVPHALSHETNKRWKFKTEIEIIGTVTGVFTRRVA